MGTVSLLLHPAAAGGTWTIFLARCSLEHVPWYMFVGTCHWNMLLGTCSVKHVPQNMFHVFWTAFHVTYSLDPVSRSLFLDSCPIKYVGPWPHWAITSPLLPTPPPSDPPTLSYKLYCLSCMGIGFLRAFS